MLTQHFVSLSALHFAIWNSQIFTIFWASPSAFGSLHLSVCSKNRMSYSSKSKMDSVKQKQIDKLIQKWLQYFEYARLQIHAMQMQVNAQRLVNIVISDIQNNKKPIFQQNISERAGSSHCWCVGFRRRRNSHRIYSVHEMSRNTRKWKKKNKSNTFSHTEFVRKCIEGNENDWKIEWWPHYKRAAQ